MKKNKYYATIVFQVFSETDEEAVEEAKSIVKEIDDKYDNRCGLLSIEKQIGKFEFKKN